MNNHNPHLPLATEPHSERLLKRIARVLFPVLTTIITVQPLAAYGAPSPSLLLQEPRFLDVKVEPNVMFMMDDSDSMNDTRLPVPAGMNPQESLGGQVSVRGWVTGVDGSGNYVVDTSNATGRLNRERVNDWIHRSNSLNPLYYNPAIHYRPWNDNRRIELNATNSSVVNTFPASSTAITSYSNDFLEGLVRHDRRYRGPNYTSSGFSSTALSTVTGANPPAASPFAPPARPAFQGFEGRVGFGSPPVENTTCEANPSLPGCGPLARRNQDIFSSPLVYVTNVQQQCLSGAIPQTSTPLDTVARGQDPRPTFANAPVTRPNFAITTETRNSTLVQFEGRNFTDTVYEARGSFTIATETRNSFTIGTETRNSTPVTYAPRNTTPYNVVTRPNTAVVTEPRPFSARTPTARPLEYRQETADCGVFGPWQPTMPGPSFCSSSTEGDRPAIIQSQFASCPAGSTVHGAGNDQCIPNCPTGTTAGLNSGTPVCWSNTCTTGTYVVNGALDSATSCRSPCSGNIIGTQCYTDCPTTGETEMVGAPATSTQCRTPCVGGNVIGGVCYTSCPGGTPDFDGTAATAVQCRSTCTGNIIGGQCYTTCPTTGWNVVGTICEQPCNAPNFRSGSLCYTSCPTAGWTPSGTQCVQPCGGTVSGSTCYTSCPTAGFIVNPGNVAQCQSPCSGGEQIGTRCYGTCPTTGYIINPPDRTQCRSQCNLPNNEISGRCYSDCPTSGFEFVGAAASATQCRTACTTVGGTVSGSQCYTACTSPTTELVGTTQCRQPCSAANFFQSGTTCYQPCGGGFPNLPSSTATVCTANCGTGYGNHPTDPFLCQATNCPTGSTLNGTNCLSCPTGFTAFGSPVQCCPSGNLQLVGTGCPAGQTCTVANTWYPNLSAPALARYFVFNPSPAIASPTAADYSNPANYVLVEINRARQFSYPNYPGRHVVDRDEDGDIDSADVEPGQCFATGPCSWEAEAENFANWYTYYRTRLHSAIAVTAQSLSNLTNGRDQIRLGYGSINYFPDGRNPYAPPPRLPNTMTIDGQPSVGHIVRGVRPFTEVVPPPAPGSDNRRQEVFDWLFSLRGIGNTPNREALDAIGRYFKRDDDQGPWIQPNGLRRSGGPVPADGWSSNEPAADQISCRRNFTIFITDGEWTRANAASGAQPLVEQRTGTAPNSLLNAFMTSAPTYSGPGVADYTYVPANQPQFTTNGGAAGGTLTDVAMQYWTRDLRTDLQNNVPVVNPSASSQGNPAFWQHLTPYLIGYGISASMDTTSVRSTIIASATGTPTAITWPSVRLEDRAGSPPETDTIITDRDRALAAGDIDCGYDPVTNPSGCGRVNDTMRAALAARGDFLSAANVRFLAQSIANAFSAIQEIDGSATSVGGRSATFQADDRIYLASFRTGRWTGRIDSYNAAAWNSAAINGTPEPTTAPDRVSSNFPAPDSRSIFTSTDLTTAVAFPTDASDFNNLSAAQRTALNNSVAMVRWLRGDQSTEALNGGSFRNRPTGELMGDIVNSTPLYSKAPDFGYSASRRPAGDTAASANAYRQFVADNRSYRPATIFVGSNGGMLHAFDVSGSPVATLPGPTPNPNYNANYMRERFAYVPRAMYSQLTDLTVPGYAHRYFVDGQVVDGDVYIASRGGWRSVVVGTSGAGPKSIFALDVTLRSGATPTAFAASDVLFDIDVATSTDPNAQYVGHIMGPGVVASVPTESGKWYYLVGNGYESASDKARLLAIDMSTGAITAIGPSSNDDGGSLPNDAVRANRPNGLGAITPVYDANRNVTGVYAGDRLGRLWKFDLSAGLSSATATMLFDTADNPVTTLDSQPITAAPRFTAHPLGGRIIVFGTGRFSERLDPESTAVQSVYAIREENPSAPVRVTWTGTKSIYTGLSLTEQTVGTGPTARRFRILDGTSGLNWASHSGWYFNLRIGTNNTGERVIVTPIENFGFMNITSYEPVAGGDRCKGGGASFFYRLDIAGSFTRVPFTETGLVSSLPITVPRTTVVGVDVPPMIGAPTLMTGGSPTTSTAGTSLTDSQLTALPRQRATATDPCATMRALNRSTLNAPVAGLPITCAIPPLRVWRDLPRGPR